MVGAQSGEPANVLGVYYEAYKWGATKITDVPSEFNVIFLFHAAPDGPPVNGSYNNAGDGRFTFKEGYMKRFGQTNMTPTHGNPAVAPALVQKVRARGQKVVLTVGGAGNGFNFNTRAKSQNFVDSFVAMNAYFLGEGGSPTAGRAFDGVDFNNFESGIGSSSTEMVWIAQQLKALYGPTFMITAPSSGATDYGWIDTNIGRALNAAGLLSFFSPQIYDDGPRYATAEKIAYEINRWISAAPSGYVAADNPPNQFGLGDASKVVIGLPAPAYSPNGSGYPLSRATAAYDLVKAKHPRLRGVFAWNFHEVQRSNRGFEGAFVPRVFNGAAPAPAPSPVASAPSAPAPVPAPTPAPAPSPAPAPVAGGACGNPPAWTGSVRYAPDTVVSRLGVLYIATLTSQNSVPEWTSTHWSRYYCAGTGAAPVPAPAPAPSTAPAPQPQSNACGSHPAWTSRIAYAPGDLVTRGGISYVTTRRNQNSLPELTPTHWDRVDC